MRTVRFTPYRKGMGPTFTLKLFYLGHYRIGYRLAMREHYNAIGGRILKHWHARPEVTLFEGEDFRPSPMHSVDGDETVKALMCFLTLRPGDTDPDYFDSYTEVQKDYCSQHAESLSSEVYSRFGE
jgi:hypothetical protein